MKLSYLSMGRTISTIIKVILGISLIYTGVKAALFFHHYDHLAYHDWYIIPALIVIAAGAQILRRTANPKARTEEQLILDTRRELRHAGHKYEVDLSAVQVIPAAEADGTAGNYSWNILTGEDKSVRSAGHVMQADVHIDGVMRRFYSDPITDLELFAIGFKMTNQKTTMLYIDKMDPQRYWLDTEWLYKKNYH